MGDLRDDGLQSIERHTGSYARSAPLSRGGAIFSFFGCEPSRLIRHHGIVEVGTFATALPVGDVLDQRRTRIVAGYLVRRDHNQSR